MSEQELPELQIVEAQAACVLLSQIPRLPVRILVLTSPEVDETPGRSLASRLVRLTGDLAADDGVEIVEREFRTWAALLDHNEGDRFDCVLLRVHDVPPDPEHPLRPAIRCQGALNTLFTRLQTRYWVLDPLLGDAGADAQRRCELLCHEVVENGGPPVLRLPKSWAGDALFSFHERLLERLLHDQPLERAAAIATGDLRPGPMLFRPQGRRHGLDLARLLEDHRSRIDEGAAALRMFKMEVKAGRSLVGDVTSSTLDQMTEGLRLRQEGLAQVREAYAEINRDRDPPGWSRLSANIASLDALKEALSADRQRLAQLIEAAASGAGV